MSKPDYIRHQLSEDQITIDWFFTSKKTGHRLRQLVLIGIGCGHVSDSHRGNSWYLSNP